MREGVTIHLPSRAARPAHNSNNSSNSNSNSNSNRNSDSNSNSNSNSTSNSNSNSSSNNHLGAARLTPGRPAAPRGAPGYSSKGGAVGGGCSGWG